MFKVWDPDYIDIFWDSKDKRIGTEESKGKDMD